MGFSGKLKTKIKEGYFKEMLHEIRWMLKYFRRYRFAVLIHILLGVAGTSMSLLSSVAMKKLIDVVTGFDTGGIVAAAALMLGLMLGSVLMNAAASRIAAVINIRVQNGIQAEVYDRMLRSDWESLEKFRSGDLINRLNGDVNTVASGVTSLLPGLVSGGVQFIGSLIIILLYDKVMALIALIGVPVTVLCSRMLVVRMREYSRKMKDIGSQVMSFHEDSFRNLSTIKSFGVMDGFRDRMLAMQETYRKALLEYNGFSVLTGMLMSILGLCISVGCFGWGVYRLWTGFISFGTMTMFLQLTNMLRSSFTTLIGLVPSAISVTTSAGRIMAVTELSEEEGARELMPTPDSCRVELRNVSFAYSGGATVLKDVCFAASQGDTVALVGPSGEGKTTMIRLILGLIKPAEGEAVIITGGEEARLSAATRSAFAYVPQGNTILAGTVADNMRMVCPDADDEMIKEALRLACAYDFVSKLPDGIYGSTGEHGGGFSEGQAQRIAIARALLSDAPVLLLDEATSALDEETERRLLANIKNDKRNRTLIIVTHRAAAAEVCDRRYSLNGTRLTEVK